MANSRIRLPGTIIRGGNRPSQTTRYEFLYTHRLKNISVFENGFLLFESTSSSFYKKRMADSSFMARAVMAEGTAGRRLGSKVFRERPIHAKTVYIMIHWTAKQASRIVRRYGRNMWSNRMVILCETKLFCQFLRLLGWGGRVRLGFEALGKEEEVFFRRLCDRILFFFFFVTLWQNSTVSF